MPPLILVIFGATGDLATRKLLPAIEAIATAGALSKKWRVVGTSRREIARDSILDLGEHLELIQLDTEVSVSYVTLAQKLREIEIEFGEPAQRLFYMSVPPSAVRTIVENLGRSGLACVPDTKLLLEKPFGTDLASATDLIAHCEQYFSPEQVYRIDHYLAKQTVQNMIVFREHNALFRRTWNRDHIERVEIRVAEKIGIEGRAHFYEQTGALCDVVQSHVLQLAALILMEPSGDDTLETVSARRLAALTHLHLSSSVPALRGQYRGYHTEVGLVDSATETYVDLTLESDAPQWIGVPIRLVAGKMLDDKISEIRIFYRRERVEEANELVLRLQPDEGITLDIWTRGTEYEKKIEKKTLDFTYAEHYDALPEAYEKVLVDVTRSDHDLFVSSEEVIESWRILAPLQEAWEKTHDDLFIYEPGSDPSS